jgi:hypothetical protein
VGAATGERFEKALDAIRENVGRAGDKAEKGEDDAKERQIIKTKRAQIESADSDFRKEFAATEKKLKDAKLPQEIVNRHAKFVKKYEDNLQELKGNLDAVEKATTASDKRAMIAKAKAQLEKTKSPSKHVPLDLSKLPHRTIKTKERSPRLNREEFEKDIPRQQKPAGLRSAEFGVRNVVAAEPVLDLIGDFSLPEKIHKKRILLAYDSTIASDIPLELPLPLGERTEVRGDLISRLIFAQATGDLPTAADLAETQEIHFTTAIISKAQELGHNPVNIYEWVRNNIEFVPTYGSIQGADGCLESRTCNAYDTASLLIALLRVSNISSRYVYGTIEVSADRFMDWAGGFSDIQSAIRFVSSSGIPVAPVVSGGVISKVQLEHPWVEAWIDYNPSRGARHVMGDTWIPLDASYKQHTSKAGVDIAASVSLDNQAFLLALGAGTTADETTGSVLGGTCAASGQLMENYRILAGNYLSQQHPNSSVGDVLGGSAVKKQEFPYLLGTLPYRVYTAGVKASEMPDSLRNIVNIRILDVGTASLDVTRSLPEIEGKQIALGFIPATQADQDVILQYLPQGSGSIDMASLPQALPAYLINVKPELRIGGITVATGGSIGLGKAMTLDVTLTMPGQGGDGTSRSISAGDYLVIMIENGTTTSGRLSSLQASIEDTRLKLQSGITIYTKEDIVANMLQAAGLVYSAELGVKRGLLERSFNVRAMMQPSILLASSKLVTTLVFGLPHASSGQGISLDMARDSVAAASRSGDLALEKRYRLASSLDASGLASRVFDDLLGGQPAVGAVRILQTAKGAGIPVHTLVLATSL